MCDERERLIGYVYDESDSDERKLVEDHLESCVTCRNEIGGLRDVRQDLLAWRVPDQEPVWRPLVAVAPVVPWWRQAPAWALVAAASVMFLAGAAGGTVASRWQQSPPRAEVATVPANAPAVTSAELSQAEQRILQLMRSELSGMDQRVRLAVAQPSPRVNASLSTSAPGGQAQTVAAASDDHQKLLTLITQAWNDFVTQQSQNKEQYQRLVRELADLRTNSGGLNR